MKSRRLLPARWSVFLALLLAGFAAPAESPVSDLKADEEILFYPSAAYSRDRGATWKVDIQGCIYEPEKRSLTISALKRSLNLYGLGMTAAEEKLLAERARLFMLDNEGGRDLVVSLGDRVFRVGKSGANGHFSGTLRLDKSAFDALASDGSGLIAFSAVLSEKDRRVFSGTATVFGATELIVISDVDDTIKITNVTDRRLMLRNTFLSPFRPVPGMADAYQSWAGSGNVQFCYVSASPWQLFVPLSEFVSTNRFPAGLFWLKDFRLTDKTVRNLFESPETYKPRVIEPLLAQYKESRFVLAGDSGEKDPEVYGALARRHPERIHRIFIRDVTGHDRAAARYQSAFRQVPDEKWVLFRDPSELPASLDSPVPGQGSSRTTR